MADYKGGEILIDLGGIDIETISGTTTNISRVNGIYSRLETAFNLGKRIVITNYRSKAGTNPAQNGVPLSVSLYRPTGNAFSIPLLAEAGISILQIVSTDAVRVVSKYTYHNIYTPPETTTNNAKILEETEETEKGEVSK